MQHPLTRHQLTMSVMESIQLTIKSYLVQNPVETPLNLESIEFLNEPNKFIYQFFTQENFGYRVCALINTQSSSGTRAHFF